MKQFKYRPKGQEGFSIVEAAVSVAIFGVLAAAALPAFTNATIAARKVEALNTISASLLEARTANLQGIPYSPPAVTTHYDYNGFNGGSFYEVSAIANDTNGSVSGKIVKACINYDTGIKQFTDNFLSPMKPVDCSTP